MWFCHKNLRRVTNLYFMPNEIAVKGGKREAKGVNMRTY